MLSDNLKVNWGEFPRETSDPVRSGYEDESPRGIATDAIVLTSVTGSRGGASISGAYLVALYHSLVRTTPTGDTPIVLIDSGATSHMTPLKGMLMTVTPASGTVSLGDTTVKLRIAGEGMSRISALGPILLATALIQSYLSSYFGSPRLSLSIRERDTPCH